MQEISIFVILKATSTDRQTRRLHIFKTFCIYLASDNTLIILVYSDQMTSEARTHKQAWAACGHTKREVPIESVMGPLLNMVTWYKNHLAGWQIMQWGEKNKEITSFKKLISFLSRVPFVCLP